LGDLGGGSEGLEERELLGPPEDVLGAFLGLPVEGREKKRASEREEGEGEKREESASSSSILNAEADLASSPAPLPL
jgi:hypothetical protein